ncbi:glycosyltransferase family 2 protein [Candidatus Saccharibacteria bacterium]|nr:glycosyltransferase family 2 protein [Candidatus Saccharibacteria bacterium]
MKNPKTIIIIPAYNEEASIQKTIQTVIEFNYDYVIINDGSTDSTEEILTKNHYNHISLISNLGIGGAVQTGYKYAYENNYDIAIQFDADGQHDIKYIEKLIKPIQDNQVDLVIGSCFIDKSLKNQRSSKIRRFGIRFLSNFIKLFSGKRIYDPTSGFRAANRQIIQLFANNYPQEYPEPISNFELLRSHKFKIKEIPVTMNKRAAGKSSINARKTIYAGINVILSILILSLRRKSHD